MLRLVWLTDIHLNFADQHTLATFLDDLAASGSDAVLISGDIAEANTVIEFLCRIDDALRRPVYFVLGNHDFYFGSIRQVREAVEELCRLRPRLTYLSAGGWESLSERVAIVGHDGWADAREGDYVRSYVMMNDYKLIAELASFNKMDRWPVLQGMGDEAAAHIRRHLPAALEAREEVFLVTHVPPLRAACWYDGRISDDEWAPHFTCQAMGAALLDIVPRYPDRRVTVLCGHTHGSGVIEPLPNLQIFTGGAEYGQPAVNKIFETT